MTGDKHQKSQKIGTPVGRSEWFNGDLDEIECRTEVKAYRIDVVCPACRAGIMEFTGFTWSTNPPGHHHKCDTCEYICAFQGRIYPSIRHEDK